MKRTRMVLVLAVGVLTCGVLASPALAVKEKPVFGKFRATVAGATKGIGEADEMTLGPYKFEECEKELHSNGTVVLGESETFFQEVKFSKCVATRNAGGGLKEAVFASFKLGMEFHSNGSLKLGPTSVTFGASNSACEVTIPVQWFRPRRNEGRRKDLRRRQLRHRKEKLEGSQGKEIRRIP